MSFATGGDDDAGVCALAVETRAANAKQHLIDEIEESLDFARHLLGRAEDVCVILREAAHPQHPVQHATALVPVHGAELSNRMGRAVGALVCLIDADMERVRQQRAAPAMERMERRVI